MGADGPLNHCALTASAHVPVISVTKERCFTAMAERSCRQEKPQLDPRGLAGIADRALLS